MFSESDPYKILIRLAGVVIGVCCLMFFPSHIMAKALPVSYQSDEDTATSERDEKIDSFLGNLDKYKDNPEEALEDLKAWTLGQNEEEKGNFEESEERRYEQIKVFFGGWTSFFVVVITLFLLKLGFNIFRDSLIFLIAKVKNFIPWLRMAGTDFMEKYLPPPETLSEDEGIRENKRE